jgi:hypothetical protein
MFVLLRVIAAHPKVVGSGVLYDHSSVPKEAPVSIYARENPQMRQFSQGSLVGKIVTPILINFNRTIPQYQC